MQYEVILEKGSCALILRGSQMDEYAVVDGLDKANGEWATTITYCGFGKYSSYTKAEALEKCLDIFRYYTEDLYITRNRLIEIATRLKDYLVEADPESARECINDELNMDDYEKEFFGIGTEGDDTEW